MVISKVVMHTLPALPKRRDATLIHKSLEKKIKRSLTTFCFANPLPLPLAKKNNNQKKMSQPSPPP